MDDLDYPSTSAAYFPTINVSDDIFLDVFGNEESDGEFCLHIDDSESDSDTSITEYFSNEDDQPSVPSKRSCLSSTFTWTDDRFVPQIHESDGEFDLRIDDSESDNNTSIAEHFSDEEDLSSMPSKCSRSSLSTFTWTNDRFVPQIHEFDDSLSGINFRKFIPSNKSTELDFFKQLLSEDVVTVIVNETNRYAAEFISSTSSLPVHSSMKHWSNVNLSEIYCFFALIMLMARNKKLSMKEYWSHDWLLRCDAYAEIMSRGKFFTILRMLHFCNNQEQPKGDQFYKISNIFTMIKQNFQSTFIPFQNLCVNRLSFKQYINRKRHKLGIKLFVLHDIYTGYVLDIIVYLGETTNITMIEELGFSGSVVMMLLQPYLRKGHSVFTDEKYTSPLLSSELHKQKTNSCGTVNPRRKEMPNVDHPKKLHRGERQSKCTDTMMVLRWQDNREVIMLTTMHQDNLKKIEKIDWKTKKTVIKPECVFVYNSCIGSVDKTNMIMSSVHCVRRCRKWYKKLFFHLLDVCLLNAHGLYQFHFNKKTSLASFQLEIIRQLLEVYHIPKLRKPSGRSSIDMSLRLTARHFPTVVPSTPKRKNAMRKCQVCTNTIIGQKKRKETRYMCSECDVGLCVEPCFRVYHTQKNY